MTYRELKDAEDIVPCKSIIRSIEMRWAKADQEVFIAAVILNPFIQTAPFSPLPFLTVGGIHVMLSRLWSRFYPNSVIPDELSEQTTNYLDGSGIFKNFTNLVDIEVKNAKLKVCYIFTSLEHIIEWRKQ